MERKEVSNPFEEISRRLEKMETNLLSKLAEKKPETPPTITERYLTVEQTTELLSVSRTTLWSWENKGILKSIRFGNLKRYRLSDIESFGQERKIYSG